MSAMADFPNYPFATTADDHLAKLLVDVEIPWYRTLICNLKDLFHPPKLPPLELTSKPVAVDDIWGLYGRQKKSFVMSTGFQMCVVAAMLVLGTSKTVQQVVKNNVLFMPVDTAPLDAKLKSTPQTSPTSSGGGGDRSPLPASFGKLPKYALRRFTPPVAVYNNMNPKLAMEPTLIGDPHTQVPNIDYPLYGDPLSHYMTPSNGTGSGGGIGNTEGNGGAGSGSGVGAGDGEGGAGGAVRGSVYRMGDGITAPVLISKVDPEYSEDARKEHREGTVLVAAEIDTTGHAFNMHVLRGLGFGLDEEAMDALKQWKFTPAKKDGKPVAVEIQVGVTFRLL